MENNSIRYHFSSIDLVRFFAAISVLVYHCIAHFSWTDFPSKFGMFWFQMGWVGVDIFFVISGFVIFLAAFSYIDRNGTGSFITDFMKKRIHRIVPLHYLTVVLFVIFIAPNLIFTNFATNILSHLFFVHNLSYITHGEINGSNWSLGAEMQFYVLVALIAPYVMKCNVFKVILPALAIVYGWRLFVVYHGTVDTPQNVFLTFVWATQLPGMLDEFLAGYLLARFVRSDLATKIFSVKYIQIILLAVSVVMAYIFFKIYLSYSAFWPFPYMLIFFRTYMAATVAVILLFLCSLRVGKAARIALKPFYYGGTISYGIYLWHLPVIMSVKSHLTWLAPAQSFAVTFVSTLVLASLSWHFFEKKFLTKNT
ncbi:acyltransferase [Dickeya chrysanthemi]|uniref:acyltransferase family protein n=1 Tax=Dickeya chrysanthemi TaxID=556 RepID=UPI0025A1F144|nr:acyltransferase [Dickeya chrysanthemi]WJM84523.1 acyltransferase [Dickeya chrysanthemi]